MYVCTHVCQPHLSERAEVVVEFSSSLRLEDVSVGLVNVRQALLRPERAQMEGKGGKGGREREREGGRKREGREGEGGRGRASRS